MEYKSYKRDSECLYFLDLKCMGSSQETSCQLSVKCNRGRCFKGSADIARATVTLMAVIAYNKVITITEKHDITASVMMKAFFVIFIYEIELDLV